MNQKPIATMLLLLVIGPILSAPVVAAPTTQPALPPATRPTDSPATRPAGGSVAGQVTFAPAIDLVGPDVSRAVVFIASAPALDALPLPDQAAVVAQRNKQFVPNFVVIRRGMVVEFPNWDHFDHNVFSRSKAAPAFDLDRYPYGQSKARQFDKLGVVQVFCNVHPSMRAMIYVTPNAFWARVDAHGHFEIDGLPPGQYEVVAWHERCGEQSRQISIAAGAQAAVMFQLEQNRASVLANDPPEKRGGYGVERGLGVKREQLNLPVVKDVHPAPAQPPDH